MSHTKFPPILISTPAGKLSCAVYGATLFANTVFYCHGFPGSRVEGEYLHESALRRGLTIIAPDRPGFGLSDFVPRRTVADFPATIRTLADHFGVPSFSVMAISGGTPYALACAAKLPEMVKKVAIVSGVAPFMPPGATAGMALLHRALISLTRTMPDFAELALRAIAPLLCRSRVANAIVFGPALSQADKELLANRAIRRLLSRNLKESLRGGGRGAAHDLRLLSGDWGFKISAISAPALFIHGSADRFVPHGMMAVNAGLIAQAISDTRQDEGHLLGIKIAHEVVEWLAE